MTKIAQLRTSKAYPMKKASKKDHDQSPEEERFNWLTHGIGVLAILISFPFILQAALGGDDLGMIACVAIFGLGMLATYSASTIYHYVKGTAIKRKLRIWARLLHCTGAGEVV